MWLIFFVLNCSVFGQIFFRMSWIVNLMCLGLWRLLRQFLHQGVVSWRYHQGLLWFDSGWCFQSGWFPGRVKLLRCGVRVFLLRLLMYQVHCKWHLDVMGGCRRRLGRLFFMRLCWLLIRSGHWLQLQGYWLLLGCFLFLGNKWLGYRCMLVFHWYVSRNDVWSISLWDWLTWSYL